ncbi:hypothetical protein BUH_5380 [Burkholderia pseudomallei Pakistan 9]|nr:hypothetical protein BUH_5380 [Burkholderia pseudomallei Pakistan 9]
MGLGWAGRRRAEAFAYPAIDASRYRSIAHAGSRLPGLRAKNQAS